MKDDPQQSDTQRPHYEPIEKSSGITAAEKYLGKLCEKTFLSLWSYPGVYRDQGKPKNGGHGKEICDLLVIFGEHIIVFSDKNCKFQNSEKLSIDWQRWFKNAIQKSAEQAWGAERWIRQNPTRIFLDRECKRALPIDLPQIKNAKFHLVVVAHGASSRIREFFGGSGSLMIRSRIQGFSQHTEPFYIGDLEPKKTFIHVFDDDSLQILMKTRDTISDFVDYLQKREILLKGAIKILATGEEQLLAVYLTKLNKNQEHDFVFPIKNDQKFTDICLAEGHWEDFQKSPQRNAQLAQDKISYVWDAIIEKFNHYALRGEQYYISSGGIKDTEKILRFMAREPRFKRRGLANALKEMLQKTSIGQRMLRVIPPVTKGDPYYVLLLFPPPSYFETGSYDEYRKVRREFLYSCCMVTRLNYPDAEDIIGIATESGIKSDGRSEDSCYFDGRDWKSELEIEAKERQKKLGILNSPIYKKVHVQEYPDVSFVKKGKIPVNQKCPCGSGKKYKRCCLNK